MSTTWNSVQPRAGLLLALGPQPVKRHKRTKPHSDYDNPCRGTSTSFSLSLSLSLEFTCSNGFSDALSVFSAVDKWPKAPPCSRSIPTPGTNKSANLCNVTNSFCQKNAGEVKDRSDSNFDKAVSTCHFRLPVFSPHPISEPWNANRLMASFVRDSPEEACCLKLTKNDKHGR